MADKLTTILLVDDHELILQGIKRIINTIPVLASVDAVTSGLRAELISLCKYDIYVLDVELPDMDSFALVEQIRKKNENAYIIMNTMHEEIWIVNKLRHPDINAVVFKSSGTEALREAVRAVMVDENYYCQRYQQLYKEKSRPDDETELPDMLPTSRELDVLKAIAQGMSTHEISRHLFISENTVEWHRKNLMLKFAARNATDLVIKALTKGYLTIPL